ncbi:vitamin D3 receptor-like isoform X2 [Tigriopus californicus]|uniref:vitamin D3 receptor-like isoform X2 n=1 Tax=Tigriopus californicus TaxID=6832 RepID=UPI0027DAA30D|nr:vitamin D3 receptor-like isoform X2 [Tigriopus californicus]
MEEEIFDDLLAITSDESPTSPEGSINSLNGVHTQGSLKSSRCCDVCAMPIDTKHASIHYGALTCYSCRAFFRRSLQKTRNPNFKCFKDGDCEVNPKSRRKCQKCRFDKCLKAGMRVEMVLTDTQKTLRFRKFLERKKQKDCSVSSSSRDLPSSSGENSCTGGSEDLSSSQSEEISGFAQEQRKMTDSFPDPMVEPSRPVHRAFDKFKNALQNLYPESPVQRLLDIIQDLGMTLLNHSNILTIDISTPSSPSSSSNGSVTWMDAQLLRFKDAFKAVPYGPDLINEMIMHSYGVPVSKSFLPQSVAVWIERALILIQTEPPSSQGTVDATVRAYQFAALHLTMLEACSTGLEQLTFTAGGDDLQVWETKYKPFVRDSSFLALPLKECRVDISRMDLERMCVLQSKLARHVPDMESFITFALVILFENTQSPDWDITDGYLSMWVDRVNCKTEVTTRSTFQSLMGDVKDLASFLQAIHGRLQYT